MVAADSEPDDDDAEASGAGRTDPDWAERRRRLAERLDAQRERTSQSSSSGGRSAGYQGMAQGLRLASEFVAGVLVGAGIGYLIDLLLGTLPFGLIVFLLFGFAAGVLNVLRSVGKTG